MAFSKKRLIGTKYAEPDPSPGASWFRDLQKWKDVSYERDRAWRRKNAEHKNKRPKGSDSPFKRAVGK